MEISSELIFSWVIMYLAGAFGMYLVFKANQTKKSKLKGEN